ncbi:DgyrCDS12861 [Dimorphilus gyrociliatus]|uniref:Mannosyltransferase n=1 Tax=Dimorphilus gyrociliatus TaxID=2664684 RepID=A0A7I8W8Z5_9ANNE|nr:DgyrCDS12861 [Dimorphilus gyrociliatus]
MALGFYNRATFIIFALMPFVIWLTSDDFHNMKELWEKSAPKLLSTIFSGVLTSLCISLLDTYYYKGLTPLDLIARLIANGFYQVIIGDMVNVPLNFITYNVQPTNLAEHGIHPRLTHFFGNTTLLYNVLAFYPLLHSYRIFTKRTNSSKRYEMPTVGEKLLLIYYIPILLLSVFPHQEARFLIPLLPLLCFLYGTVFFSQCHQGGVVQALEYVKMSNSSGALLFWKTYMPPRHLLFQNASNPQLKVIDLMGSSQQLVHEQINRLTLGKHPIRLLNSSNDNQCPLHCSVYCECVRYKNGTHACRNCEIGETDLSDKHNEFGTPYRTTETPKAVPTEKLLLQPGEEEIISYNPLKNPVSSWRVETSSNESKLSILMNITGSGPIKNCPKDLIEIYDVHFGQEFRFCPWNITNSKKLYGSSIQVSLNCQSGNYNKDTTLSIKFIGMTTNSSKNLKTVDKLLIVMACVCIFLFIVFLTVAILVIIKFRQNRLARQRQQRANNSTTNRNSAEQSNGPSISVISPPSYDTICDQPPTFLDYMPEEKPLPGTAPPAYASFRSNQQRTRQPKNVINTQASTEA